MGLLFNSHKIQFKKAFYLTKKFLHFQHFLDVISSVKILFVLTLMIWATNNYICSKYAIFSTSPPTLYSYDEPPSLKRTFFQDITPFKKLIIPPKKTFEYGFKIFYLRYSGFFSFQFFRVRNMSLEIGLLSKYNIY